MVRDALRLPPLLDSIVMRTRIVILSPSTALGAGSATNGYPRKRVLLLASLVLIAAACSGPKVSKQKATAIIEAAPSFKSVKLVYLPRVIAIPADGIVSSTATREGEALNIIQIASVDPVVAVLRARDQVTIEDFVSAVPGSIVIPSKTTADTTAADSGKSPNDSTKSPPDSTKPRNDSTKRHVAAPPPRLDESHTSPPPAPPLAQAWTHMLRVTPRPQTMQSAELAADDGDDNPESPRVAYTTKPIGRTPGWTLAVGLREFMRILEVTDYTPRHGEPPGEVRIDFLWRWRATKPGAPFDTESAEFQSLPPEVQQAALTGAVTINSNPHWSRATLAREGTGWKVTSVDWGYGDDKPHDRW